MNKILIAISALLFLALVYTLGGDGGSSTTNAEKAKAAKVNPMYVPSENPPTPVLKQSSWRESVYADDMSKGLILHKAVISNNSVSFDFPYQGEQHATLIIRQHPRHGRNVIIQIEKGQMLDSDYHSKVLVRFDDSRALAFSSSGPDDRSTEALFLNGAFQTFLSRLKTAKTLKIQVPIYQNGSPVFEFDVEGFIWN